MKAGQILQNKKYMAKIKNHLKSDGNIKGKLITESNGIEDKTGIEKRRENIAYLLNAILFVFGLAGLIISILKMSPGSIFLYYTQDSNIFSMIVSFIYIIYGKKNEKPDYVKNLRFSATVCLTLTFMVVTFVLGPMYGVKTYLWLYFEGANIFYHLLCPMISIISFVIFENRKRQSIRMVFIAVIPTIVYAICLVILNVIHIVHGPYPFLYVYEQPVFMSIIWALMIPGAALGFAFLIRAIKSRCGCNGAIERRKD